MKLPNDWALMKGSFNIIFHHETKIPYKKIDQDMSPGQFYIEIYNY